jgi:serine/threonine protein kinase
MPFLKGEPLEERLKSDELVSIPEVLRIGREAAEGLGAAHAAGLIHRDIKPANIWLEAPKGRVKILDFGLARAAAQESGLTQQGAIIGTPAYMAPEQGRADKLDGRCDLWTWGGTLRTASCRSRADTVSTLMAVRERPAAAGKSTPRSRRPVGPGDEAAGKEPETHRHREWWRPCLLEQACR